MSLSEIPTRRNPMRAALKREPSRDIGLPELLNILGYRPDEFVSIAHKGLASGAEFTTSVVSPSSVPTALVELAGQKCDVWFGVNPTPGPERVAAGRGKTGDITRIAALIADLDAKGDADSAACVAIVDELSTIVGTRPSAVVRSGNGGLHPYWPVADGAITDTAEAEVLNKRWGRLVKAVARRHGAKADSVFDLPRVMRVPRTTNWKHGGDGKPVVGYADSGRPLTVSEVVARLDECGVSEEDGDRGNLEPLSNPDNWKPAAETCAYVRTILDGIPADVPNPDSSRGRHGWLCSLAVRLACAARLGCISEDDYQKAGQLAYARLSELRAETGESVPDLEVPATFAYGVEKAATKTVEQARAELGGHDHEAPKKSKERSQASRLVDIALDSYRVGISTDGKPFGYSPSVPHVALDLRGGKLGLRQTLARDYFKRYDAAATSAAIASACGVLEGMARDAEPTQLHLRVAGGQEAVYVDMADERNRVIEIRGGDWRVVNESPHMFRRTELTQAVPEPSRDGDLSKLWQYLNIREEDRPLLVAVLVDALINPDTGKPVAGFTGEHGTAKSASTSRFVSLIDPSDVPLHSPPKDLEHWLSAAAGSWVVGLDNLSSLPDWLSDALCRASTGSGSVKRQLYTDDGLAVVRFRRCVVFNGIDVGGMRGDLADRLISFELQQITEDQRKTDAALERSWEEDWPAIYGGVLDLAAEVHDMLPDLPPQPLPRMADFARVLICVDKIAGTNGMQRYRDRLSRAMNDSATSDSFIERLVDMGYDTGDEGRTAGEILHQVGRSQTVVTPPQDWPRSAKTVTARLKRNAPALRSMGWQVSNDGGSNKTGTTKWILRPPGGGEAGEIFPAPISKTVISGEAGRGGETK